jgi:hypothetical protein
MNQPKLPDDLVSAAMQRLVDEGRAEWTVHHGEPALRLTELGRAMLRQPRTPETVQ